MRQTSFYSVALACVLASSAAWGQDSLPYRPSFPPQSSRPAPAALGAGEAAPGFTLFQPMFGTTAYLIDELGDPVHTWDVSESPGLSVYLLENGNLLRTGAIGVGPGGGGGGRVQELTWDGTVLWTFDYSSGDGLQHHDVEPLPNGNVLLIAWEFFTGAQAIDAGRNPALLSGNALAPDAVIEIQPDGNGGASIVWEWHLWDHMIQDFDPGKDNFGVVADHPELVDLNYPPIPSYDWVHVNAIDYNAELDQIVLCTPFFNEVWVIDHSTTTAEAAGHTGGDSGKGGDLLYRWGNPEAYRRGTPADRKLFGQHDAQWIEPGRLGAGNFIVYNNGRDRPAGDFSSIEEWVPPVDGSGNYTLPGGAAYGPANALWTYTAPVPTDFYSSIISGTERLPNGNTLICNGVAGHLFEVTPALETVWEYDNPYPDMGTTWVFHARRHDVCALNGEPDCPELGTTYCDPAVPNSTGQPGEIFVRGSDSVGDDLLELTALQLPAGNNIGYFIMGTGMNTFVPPGSSGPICIAPGIKRFLPPVSMTSELDGGFTRDVGTAGPVSGNITAGSTWNFQAWHRDGMNPSNLTHAVSVTFQ